MVLLVGGDGIDARVRRRACIGGRRRAAAAAAGKEKECGKNASRRHCGVESKPRAFRERARNAAFRARAGVRRQEADGLNAPYDRVFMSRGRQQEERVNERTRLWASGTAVGFFGFVVASCSIPTVNGTPTCNAGEVRVIGNLDGVAFDERYGIVSSSFTGGGFSTMSAFEAAMGDKGRVFVAFNGYASDDPTFAQEASVRFPTESKAAPGATIEGGDDSTVSATTTRGRFVMRPIRKDGASIRGELLGCWAR